MSDYIFFHLIIPSCNVWHVREHMVSNFTARRAGVNWEGGRRIVDLASFVALGGWKQMATTVLTFFLLEHPSV